MPDYYTLWTETGQAKIANAEITGNKIQISEMAFGDGDGGAYDPTKDQESLKNEVYRRDINDKYIDSGNDNWVIFEAVIPENVGDFYVREVGLFDSEGDLVVIAKYPETYKPVLESGAGTGLYVRMITQISNADLVELSIDPSTVLATKEQADRIEDKLQHSKVHNVPGVGSVFEVDSIYEKIDKDFGGITYSAPFSLEHIPDELLDFSKGDRTIDLGGI